LRIDRVNAIRLAAAAALLLSTWGAPGSAHSEAETRIAAASLDSLTLAVAEAEKRYAGPRSEGENPLGWRQDVKVQTLILRFCWHDALSRLWEEVVVTATEA
jgi:hypothetical protein